jgi:hypothetical protein
VRELAMLLALVAPTALAQQAAPVTYDASWSKVSGGSGNSSATSTTSSAWSRLAAAPPAAAASRFRRHDGVTSAVSRSPNDAIFLNGFD